MSEVRRDIVTDTWVIIDIENDSIPKIPVRDSEISGDCPDATGLTGKYSLSLI